MTKRLSRISIQLFLTWLHRRRVKGAWRKLDLWDEDGPFGGGPDPWTAVVDWIARHTGFQPEVVEAYMSGIARQPQIKLDPYVSRELFAWWENGNDDKLIRAFWVSYPEVAEAIQYLPKPKKLKKDHKLAKRPGRKRGKQPPRTTLTPQEKKVKRGLEAGLRNIEIANRLGVTPGRVSQIAKQIETVEAAAASRSLPMRQMATVRNDYSPEAPSPKRAARQRKRKSDEA